MDTQALHDFNTKINDLECHPGDDEDILILGALHKEALEKISELQEHLRSEVDALHLIHEVYNQWAKGKDCKCDLESGFVCLPCCVGRHLNTHGGCTCQFHQYKHQLYQAIVQPPE